MTETMKTPAETVPERPPGLSDRLWQAMVEQGTVYSSRGENLPEVTEEFWASEEEFQEFLDNIRRSRAEGK